MNAPPLVGRAALVTGGTGGAGRETALGLAKLGAVVTVVGRDRARGEAAVEHIRRESGNDEVRLMLADLSSLADVRALADRFAAEHSRLDLLVNHPAGFFAERRETADGHEATLALTHLAPALLTHRLLPLLRASAPSRVVNVSSGAHRWARLRWDDLQSAQGYRGFDAHARARLLNLAWTHELARRVRGTGITVVAADPGSRWMTDGMRPEMLPLPLRLLAPVLRRVRRARTAEAAARTALVAATSRDVASAAYLGPRGRVATPARISRDGETALRAWEETARLLGVDLDPLAATRKRRKAAEPATRFTAPRLAGLQAAA